MHQTNTHTHTHTNPPPPPPPASVSMTALTDLPAHTPIKHQVVVEVETWHAVMVMVMVLAAFVSVRLSLRASPPPEPVNRADTRTMPSGSHGPDSSPPLCQHRGGHGVETSTNMWTWCVDECTVCVCVCVYGNITLIMPQYNNTCIFFYSLF